ncbi:Flp pilus assembly complex ATPase component TadA [Candidatus Microgenomates bacterium]|nr:Flp pilus assembly complex ATPase component TadA [Candidatus Microgenomates bacterium]
MLSVESQQKVEDLLIKQKIVTPKQLDELKKEAVRLNRPLLALLVEKKQISSEDLTKLTARATNVPYVNLLKATIEPEITKLLPRDVAEQFMTVPLGEMEGKLAVGMLDPSNIQAIDYVSGKVGRPLAVFMASQEGINHVLAQYSTDVAADVRGAIATSLDLGTKDLDSTKGAQAVATLVQDSPITRALKAILDYAVQGGASDVHIEPTAKDVRIRCRIDGILREVMTLPKSVEPALISRVKILSSLKIDEHRIPQDGQFQFTSGSQEIDVRVAISPVVWGEQVVLRLLNKEDRDLTLEDLGLKGRALRLVNEGSERPHGMILSTGPTGSGKSTTLYTLLQKIKSEAINVVTLEDPVERKIEGVNQIQVNPAVGLTFASGLRSVLRQDPDVVLVGEIRDKETATLAVQAALTGHLVLSTLHTNSAAGVLPRLLDMGIEPFLIASTVNTVIGQRLVRRICKDFTKYQSSLAETRAINDKIGQLLPKSQEEVTKKAQDYGYEDLPLLSQNAYTLFKGKASDECPGGYKGRIGIFEVFNMSDAMEQLLTKHATSGQIQEQAQKEGMIIMQQDGYFKAVKGVTTLEEVERVAAES